MSRESNVQKLSTVPVVHDATQPSPESVTATRPKPGALVAAAGEPIDGGVAVYDAALGYCVWQAGEFGPGADYAWLYLTGIDGATGATVLITDEDGEPIAAFSPVS